MLSQFESAGLVRSTGDRPRLHDRVQNDLPANMLVVGLVNNMPKAARDTTERQFRNLLELGAGSRAVHLRLFDLHASTGGDTIASASHYSQIYRIWNARLDALVITGTEPRARDLQDEPYWDKLVDLLDWADSIRLPVILSCLAAHAGVLHADGITRRHLPDKCFGLFPQTPAPESQFTRGLAPSILIPHSRWNNLEEQHLIECGYEILTRSPQIGVDIFARKRRNLTLYFQGHPEYDPETLALEYRRDVRRFLQGIQDTYPKLPNLYFDRDTCERLKAFRKVACVDRHEDLMAHFPDVFGKAPRHAPWRSAAAEIYRNWLTYVDEHRS